LRSFCLGPSRRRVYCTISADPLLSQTSTGTRQVPPTSWCTCPSFSLLSLRCQVFHLPHLYFLFSYRIFIIWRLDFPSCFKSLIFSRRSIFFTVKVTVSFFAPHFKGHLSFCSAPVFFEVVPWLSTSFFFCKFGLKPPLPRPLSPSSGCLGGSCFVPSLSFGVFFLSPPPRF